MTLNKYIFLIIVLVLSSFMVSAGLTDDNQGFYPMTSDCITNSNGVNGTNNGATFINSTEGCDFESSESDYVDIDSVASADYSNGGTICGWIKQETYGSRRYVAGLSNDDGLDALMGISTYTSFLNAYSYKSDGDGAVNANGVINIASDTTNWYHVCNVFSSTGAPTVYENGVAGVTGTATNNVLSVVGDASIGSINWRGSELDFFDGNIMGVGIWNGTKSSGDILELYNGGRDYDPFEVSNTTINDSVESTAVVKQIGTVSTTGPTVVTVFDSDFNITVNNTDLYGAYSFNVLSAGTNTLFCELLIDSVVVGNVTRSQTPGVLGSTFLQSPVFTLENGTHNQQLRCNRASGTGQVTISNAIGIGHILINEDNGTIPHSNISFDSVANTGDYVLLDELNFTISNNTVGGDDNVSHMMVVDWSMNYVNNAGSTELLNTVVSINGSNCSFYPRTVNSGGVGSVSGDCMIEGAIENATYNIKVYGTGTNAEYEGTLIVKEFSLSPEEIEGGTGFPVPLSFTGDTDTLLFNISDSGNLNHAQTNVFQKVAFSISSNETTDAIFYVKLVDGTDFQTVNFTRTITSDVGVLIGHDILQNVGQDTYFSELWANCGSPTASCTISGGDGIGYITDVTTTISNSFNVEVLDNFDDSAILNFTVSNGAKFSTTNGNVTYFTSEDLVNLTITSDYNGGYLSTQILNHNTTNDLTVYLNQSIINFNCIDKSNEAVACSNSSTYNYKAGTYNWSFGAIYNGSLFYYTINKEITINAKDNKTINITGFFNQKVSFEDDLTGTPVTDLTCEHNSETYTIQPLGLATYSGITNLTCYKTDYYPITSWTLNQTLQDITISIEEYKFKAYFSETIDWTITDVNNVTSGSNSSIILKQSSFEQGTVILRWNNGTQTMEWDNQYDETISVYLLVYNESMDISKLIRVKENGALSEGARVTVEYHDGSIWRVIQGKLTNPEGEAIVSLPNNHDFRVTVQKTGYTAVQDTFSTGSDNDLAKVMELTASEDKDDHFTTNCDNSFVNNTICTYRIICGNACSQVSINYNITYISGTESTGTSTYITSTGNDFTIPTTGVDSIIIEAFINGESVGNATANRFNLEDKDMDQILDKEDITQSSTSVRVWTIAILIFGAIIGGIFEKKVMKNSGIYTQAGIYLLSGIFIPVMLAYGSIIGIVKLGVMITKRVFSQ